jgi:15-cis-phytoene synthase
MSSKIATDLESPVTVEQSYEYCRKVARARAKNFYYSFLLLDRSQRDAMCAIYAFMRYCDDLSDDPASKDKTALRLSIAMWRVQLDRALRGDVVDHAIWPAFHDTIKRYSIPHRFFHEMIDGITSDIEPKELQTYDELYRYCYQVASVVGLTIIHIFGFQSVRALLLAEKCGFAFQLTNILRDVREDAELGRIYLPREDLERFGVTREQLHSGKEDNRFRKLMQFEASRARAAYDESAQLMMLIEPRSRKSLWALRAIYLRLLAKIERAKFGVLSRRINVSKPAKIALLLRAYLR